MTTELGPVEREAELGKLRRRMRRAVRRGDAEELGRLGAEYERRKGAHVSASHAEMKAAMRARRAEERAQEAREASGRWRLPRGFASPLAAERARSGWRPREEPSAPAGGLRPWRGRHPFAERIWRP